MTHGSLFSGIGGFDLAAEWTGWENLFNCEWEEFPRKVLKHHFPNAKQYEDIKDFDATKYNGRIDILSGGFPCQPFSVAGKRKGSEDERHLWPEMLRVIGECEPRWVVGENVRGLVSWSDGLVFETCCTDLEAFGYSVQSFVIPACAAGAPHRRDRVWIVAQNTDRDEWGSNKRKEESNGRGFGNIGAGDNVGVPSNDAEVRNAPDTQRLRLEHTEKSGSVEERERKTRLNVAESIETNGERGNAPDTDGERLQRKSQNRELERSRLSFNHARSHEANWENFPTQPPICGGDDGLPKELDGITFSKWRKESIKAYGNAIVPQVAHRIFESINDYENDTN